jgi:hypothetical protein
MRRGQAWRLVHESKHVTDVPMGVRDQTGVRWRGSRPGFVLKEHPMADKSPRQHMSKKAGKSLKEKRAEKHLKQDAKDKAQIVPPGRQR